MKKYVSLAIPAIILCSIASNVYAHGFHPHPKIKVDPIKIPKVEIIRIEADVKGDVKNPGRIVDNTAKATADAVRIVVEPVADTAGNGMREFDVMMRNFDREFNQSYEANKETYVAAALFIAFVYTADINLLQMSVAEVGLTGTGTVGIMLTFREDSDDDESDIEKESQEGRIPASKGRIVRTTPARRGSIPANTKVTNWEDVLEIFGIIEPYMNSTSIKEDFEKLAKAQFEASKLLKNDEIKQYNVRVYSNGRFAFLEDPAQSSIVPGNTRIATPSDTIPFRSVPVLAKNIQFSSPTFSNNLMNKEQALETAKAIFDVIPNEKRKKTWEEVKSDIEKSYNQDTK